MLLQPSLAGRLIASFLLAALLGSCAAAATLTPQPTPTLTPAVAAYRTPTPSPSPSGRPPTATAIPSATPTLLTYAVKTADDMFGIAYQFGISVSALKTANPKVHPNYMGVGTVLVIPVTPTPPSSKGTQSIQPTPASPDFTLSPPHCYADAAGGLWCLALARSGKGMELENVSAVFRLSPAGGGKTLEQTVYAPLNVLPGDAALPVAAYFDPPAPAAAAVDAQPADALPLASGDTRYPAAQVQGVQIQINGGSGLVTGTVRLAQGGTTAREIWVLAAAYDSGGNPVGLRKWESPTGLSGEAQLPFTLSVYSLGPAIDHVVVLAEAHN